MGTETHDLRIQKQTEQRGKHWARRLALQALYQWDLNGENAEELLKQFADKQETNRVDMGYFEYLVNGVLTHNEELQKPLIPILDRALNRIDPVERAVLRIACFELACCPELPTAVVLSEATQLARKFGTEKGSKYVNAVLDKVADTLRTNNNLAATSPS